MRFAGFEIVSEFGLVRTVSDDFMNFTIDGILGLGPEPADSTTSYMDMDTVMDTLAKQGAIQKKMYGVALARASDPVNDGVLNFGGVDPSMYEGEVMFSNIVAGSTLWHIILEGAKVLGKDLELGGGRSAVIDTGTSLVSRVSGKLMKRADGFGSCLRLFRMRFGFTLRSRMRRLLGIRLSFLAILPLLLASRSITYPTRSRRRTTLGLQSRTAATFASLSSQAGYVYLSPGVI